LNLTLDHTVTVIDAPQHAVHVEDRRGGRQSIAYDRLIVATGAEPISPDIPGLDLPGVFVLHTMDDSFRVHEALAAGSVREAVIAGSGYIGLELADALAHRGVHVTLIGRAESVLPTVDPPLGQIVANELRRHGVDVIVGAAVEGIERVENRLCVRAAGGVQACADLVLVAAGVRPNSVLAASAGVETGITGAIKVDRHMATNLPDVYAAGDCVETWHRITGRYTYLPLGTTAHKQGRVAGDNAVGGDRVFEGSVGTQVVKVFDLAIDRTGLKEDEAREAAFDPLTVNTEAWDHKAYSPGAQRMRLRVTGDRQTGRLLSCQMVGPWHAEIAKRIDIYATALFHAMTVDGINDLDLSYTPPSGSPWDAVQVAAQAWERTRVGAAAS
jgi:NADPH-dependent 2,4-dienoyl-CoA reductase/sulfur reductase-like enzyme